jgi:hypothetical protein
MGERPAQLLFPFGIGPPERPPFYYEAPDWDDRMIEEQVDRLVAKGFPVPVWNYPLPRPYNGATGYERRHNANKFYVARNAKLIPWGTHCSICMKRGSLGAHNENYFRPCNARPICRGCHMLLHKRFRHPGPWLAHARQHAFTGAWFTKMAVHELTRQQALYLASLADPFDVRQIEMSVLP